MRLFIKHAIKKECVYRSAKVALVVGTILAIINHYDVLFTGVFTKTDILQIVITYFVPYSVATFGSACEARRIELSHHGKFD